MELPSFAFYVSGKKPAEVERIKRQFYSFFFGRTGVWALMQLLPQLSFCRIYFSPKKKGEGERAEVGAETGEAPEDLLRHKKRRKKHQK